MKHFEEMPPEANGPERTIVEVTSAEDAPETKLDLQRPDPEATVAAGELVQPATTPQPQMRIQLLVVLGRTLIHEANLRRPTINIGRDARQDLAIDDPSVSRQHCQICFEQGDYILRDLGTSNGTTLNGRASVAEKLLPGDEIGIGRFVVIFCPTKRQREKLEWAVNAVVRPQRPSALTRYLSGHEIDSVRQAVRTEREAHLLSVDRAGALGQRVELEADRTTLGRPPASDLPIGGVLVADQHAEIIRRGDRFLIRKLGSWRRVRVNGRAVSELELSDGDTIRIAQSTWRFFEPAR
jgi:pSer/pThr/pTyr-binding forkhead associated (FHA) protein